MDHLAFIFMLTTFEIIANVYFMFLCFSCRSIETFNVDKTKSIMTAKEKEVAEEYFNALADLNINSKPLINMLTMLAEENSAYAPIIVQCIERQLHKVFKLYNSNEYFTVITEGYSLHYEPKLLAFKYIDPT